MSLIYIYYCISTAHTSVGKFPRGRNTRLDTAGIRYVMRTVAEPEGCRENQVKRGIWISRYANAEILEVSWAQSELQRKLRGTQATLQSVSLSR